MRLLVAYDGSPASDNAIDSLMHAALPADASALVLSVAETWVPAEQTEGSESVKRLTHLAHERSLRKLEEARAIAERGAERVRARFPGWSVAPEAVADSPAWGIIRCAEEWSADMIVVGAYGQSMMQRLMLGGVSQKVLSEAHCHVHVGREGGEGCIVLGFDGSGDACAAVKEIVGRSWPDGTRLHIVSAIDEDVEEETKGQQEWIEMRLANAVPELESGNLSVTHVVRVESPRALILAEAELCGASLIVVGARGHSLFERALLGSVSSAVVHRAHCSVEVIRP